MKIINIGREQIVQSEDLEKIIENNNFFAEYFSVFKDNDEFIESSRKSMADFTPEQVENISDQIINITENKLSLILKETGFSRGPGVIIFIGDGSWDGHGIIIDGKPYVFFDLASQKGENEYNLQTYITHELIHPFHYYYSPDFYPGNYVTLIDKYFRKMIAEGLATFLGYYFSGYDIADSYWLGIFNEKQVKKWIDNCKKAKSDIASRLQEVLREEKYDEYIYYKLFAIISEDFAENRYGYYYGTKIVENIFQNMSPGEIIEADFEIYRDEINNFFGRDLV